MEITLELNDRGYTSIDEAVLNLEVIDLALSGIGEINKYASISEPSIYSLQRLILDTLNLLRPHVTAFCTKCNGIYTGCECKSEPQQPESQKEA